MRINYHPIYFDTPAAVQATSANSDNDPWYDPADVDVYGNPLGATLTANDTEQPVPGPDLAVPQSPTARIRQFGGFSDSTVVNPAVDTASPYSYYQQREQSQRPNPFAGLSDILGTGYRTGGLERDYMHQLALRAMLMAQNREKTLKEKLLEDYFARVLRGGGAPI